MNNGQNYIKQDEAWFKENLKALLEKHENKWVVVYQQNLLGVFDSFSEAYEKGTDLANSEKILVKQVRKEDEEPRDISINFTLGLYDAPYLG